MKVFTGVVVTCVLLAAYSVEARDRFRSGQWDGGSYGHQSGRFTHCAMSAQYRGGTLLAFILTRSGGLQIGLINRSWSLTPGQTYTAVYAIDQAPARTVGAIVKSAQAVWFPVPSTRSMLNQLRRGRGLRLNVAGSRYGFRLTGTAIGLQRLLYCVKSELARERGVSLPPFGTPVRRANATRGGKMSAARAELRLRATTMVANMINRAGLRDARILTPEQAPKRMRGYDVVWRAPGVLGGLQIIPPKKHLTAERLTAALLASDAAACKGSFKSGIKTDALSKSSRTVRLFTDCQGLESWRSLYSIMPIPKGGGFVMVGQFAEAATEKLEETDRKIVEALPAVLQR